MSPSYLWATRRTLETMNTHAGSWPRWNRWRNTLTTTNDKYPSICHVLAFSHLTLLFQEPVKSEEGKDMAQRIGAFGYLECSAKTKDGVREVFEMATRAALQVRKRKKRGGCQLLWGVCICWLINTLGRTLTDMQNKLRETLNPWLP